MSVSFQDQYPYVMEGRVEWADMDAFAHVNNTLYLRYFERIRMELMEELGAMAWLEEHQVGPILASTACRFKLPLAYPDAIVIGTRITDLAEDEFNMDYAVYGVEQGRVAAEGEGRIVYYDYAGRSRAKIPDHLLERLAGYCTP